MASNGHAKSLNGYGGQHAAPITKSRSTSSKPIGGLDNVWLTFEDMADFNAVCLGTYTFADRVSLDAVIKVHEEQLASFPKYRQRVANVGSPWRTAHFEDDPNFDLHNHVTEHHLPGERAGRDELEEFCSSFLSRGWDLTRPLWEAVLLQNYTDDMGAESALVIRGHHTLSDGQGFVLTQLSSTSFGSELSQMLDDGAKTLHAVRTGSVLPSKLNPHLAFLDRFHTWFLPRLVLRLLMLSIYWTTVGLSLLTGIVPSFRHLLETAFIFILTYWRAERVTPDYPGPRVKEREFSVSASFPMHDVKRLQKAFSGAPPGSFIDDFIGPEKRGTTGWNHVTLNDVVVTVVSDVIADELAQKRPDSGAFRRLKTVLRPYLPTPIGLFIPISLREPGDWSMRNLSTGAFCYVPGLCSSGPPRANPSALYARVQKSRDRLTVLKKSHFPRIAFAVLNKLGTIPILFPAPFSAFPRSAHNPIRQVTKRVLETALQSFCAVLTNVPGPPGKERVTLAGSTVLKWTALPPQAGKGTLGIGVISYADTICISVVADRVEGAEGVARRLTDGFERRWGQWMDAAEWILTPKSSRVGSRATSPPPAQRRTPRRMPGHRVDPVVMQARLRKMKGEQKEDGYEEEKE